MNETNLLREVLLALTKSVKNCRLFRNNTGSGWQGKSYREGNKLIISDARPIQAGLCLGSSDLIGWTTVKITPEMVGASIAVFTAMEVKTAKGRVSPEQLVFLSRVGDAGGFAYIVKSDKQAVEVLSTSAIERIIQTPI